MELTLVTRKIPGGEFLLVDLLRLVTDIGLEFAIVQVWYNQFWDHLCEKKFKHVKGGIVTTDSTWDLLPIGFMVDACLSRPIGVNPKVGMCT